MPQIEQSVRGPLRASKLPRSTKAIYGLLLLLLVVVAGLAFRPAVRREHLRLVVLRNQVEAAAAPDEPVIVADPMVAGFLMWRGSAALRRQLYLSRGGRWPESLPVQAQEVVIVATDGDPLLSALRAKGYVLTPDASQRLWSNQGNAVRVPGRGAVHIYFAVRAAPTPVSSRQQEM